MFRYGGHEGNDRGEKKMCGIVGYIGKGEAYPVLISGLKLLEYRGYDSAGVGVLDERKEFHLYKVQGNVSRLKEVADVQEHGGHVGIAHTRWATHGAPNVANAHPHQSQDGHISLVHNGIIENYTVLKRELAGLGYGFKSDTDSEVLVQFISYNRQRYRCPLAEAVRISLHGVTGSFAIAVVDDREPDAVVVARRSCPLAVGVGKDGSYYIASDITPILPHTKDVVYPDDDEIVRLSAGGEMEMMNMDGVRLTPAVTHVEMTADQVEKEGYDHYMEKEIHQQPQVMRECMAGRVLLGENRIYIEAFEANRERFMNASRIVIVACGTSWHAGLVARYAFEQYAHTPCVVEYASEYRYRRPVILPTDVVVVISQSGETADSIAAIGPAKERGAFVYAVCNVDNSTIVRMADACTLTKAGIEIGVASTKAFTAQVLVLTMLAAEIGRAKGVMGGGEYSALINDMVQLPQYMEYILSDESAIRRFAATLLPCRSMLYLGRGNQYPIALEGALKIKEISYIHAEGYPIGEMKHGPIALIEPEVPSVVIATKCGEYDKTVSNIQEIMARQGRITAIATKGDTVLEKMVDNVIYVPDTHPLLMPILTVVPLQLLAYHVAVGRGCNVDQPRNLAKSVTVE